MFLCDCSRLKEFRCRCTMQHVSEIWGRGGCHVNGVCNTMTPDERRGSIVIRRKDEEGQREKSVAGVLEAFKNMHICLQKNKQETCFSHTAQYLLNWSKVWQIAFIKTLSCAMHSSAGSRHSCCTCKIISFRMLKLLEDTVLCTGTTCTCWVIMKPWPWRLPTWRPC
jgi:hypothetical protein